MQQPPTIEKNRSDTFATIQIRVGGAPVGQPKPWPFHDRSTFDASGIGGEAEVNLTLVAIRWQYA